VYARVIAALTMAASFAAGPAVLAAQPAAADEVAQAQNRVDRLQVLVRETTAQLLDGTEKWEQDRAALQQVQAQLVTVSAKVRQQEAVAAAGRARVGIVARRMYMTPINDKLRLAVGMDADQVLGMIRTESELQHVAASDSEVVRRAQVAQQALERTRQQVTALTRQAQQLADSSARRLRALNALADRTSAQLVAAQDELQQARARRAARLARVAAQRALAARMLSLDHGAAYCRTSNTGGMSNGQLDADALCPLWSAPGQRLRTDASKAFNAMSRYHAKTLGAPLCVTDSYRSYAQQVDVYHRKPGLAAVPGTSQHGWGLAVDLCGGVQSYGTPAFNWMKANGPRFGFHHPAWAEPTGSRPEAWHWEYTPPTSDQQP
jgi:LAS superfamily LD-carboxypeptidase LdcB